MTTQIIPGNGHVDALATTATTEYNSIYGGFAWSTEVTGTQLIASAGAISRLRIRLSAAPGDGDTYVFTVRKASGTDAMADTALTVTITGATATTGDDLTHSVSVSPGDRVSLQCVSTTSGTLSGAYAQWCTSFTPTTAGECLLMGGVNDTLSVSATEYNAAVGSGRVWSTTENISMVVIPTDGTIKDLYMWLSGTPGSGGDAFTLTLRRGVGDGTSMGNTLLTCTATDSERTANDTTHDIDVAAGDVITIMSTYAVSPTARYAYWGMVFVPDVSGEFPIMGGTYNDTASDATARYLPVATNYYTWGTAETNRGSLMEACVLKKFRVYCVTPIAAGSLVLEVRDVEGPTVALTTTITADDIGSDVSSEYTLTDGIHRVSFKYQAAASTTVTDLKWGFTGYISAASQNTKTFTADAVLVYRKTKELTVDAILVKRFVKDVVVDTVLVEPGVLVANQYTVTAKNSWTKVGTTPYVGVVDYPNNYVWSGAIANEIGDFDFENTAETRDVSSIVIRVYCSSANGTDRIEVYVDPGTGYVLAGTITPDEAWAWKTLDVSTVLYTATKVNAAKVYLKHVGAA